MGNCPKTAQVHIGRRKRARRLHGRGAGADGGARPRGSGGGATKATSPTMSRRGWPYILTQEDSARLLAVLARQGDSL